MKVNLKDKKCLVIDNGIFLEMAIRLSKDFGTVYYWTPWISGFPSKKMVMCGVGMDGITRVNDWEQMEDEIDVFVFPDVYFQETQNRLRKKGKFVFGSGNDDLELYRWETRQWMKTLSLPVQPIKRIFGLDKLREHLKTVENKWIKISKYRGDGETWHHEKYRLSEPILNKWERDMGPMQWDYEFIVEDSIDGDDVVECGSDTISIDGQYPDYVIQGYEQKDLGYIATVAKYSEMSPIITEFNRKIAPFLKEVKYRMFFSTEIRVGKDKKAYMMDFCNRCGSPPNELYQNMLGNMGEMVWWGSQGVLVQPEYKAKFGLEVLIHSDWAASEWQALYFPEKIREHVKLRNACKIKDTYFIIPQSDGMPEIGAVVAIGDTIEECQIKMKEYCDQIEGYRIDLKVGSIDEMLETAKKGEKLGIKFF